MGGKGGMRKKKVLKTGRGWVLVSMKPGSAGEGRESWIEIS